MNRPYALAIVATLLSALNACGGSQDASSENDPEVTALARDGGVGTRHGGGASDASVLLAPAPVVTPGTLRMLVEPSDKAEALLAAILAAKTSVHMTMYMLNDPRFIDALIAKKQAGRDVKVVLNEKFPPNAGSNQPTFDQLKAAGVPVVWAPATFSLTHQKTVIIDSAVAARKFSSIDDHEPVPSQASGTLHVEFPGCDLSEANPRCRPRTVFRFL
jgi:hypothetical protein